TAAAIGAAGVVVVLSQSRTGLIVFLLVLGLTFIRRMGAWGVVLGCLIGPPMLLLGGRSGADADQSTEERLELVLDGLEMIKSTRGIGVGVGQFGAESGSGLTAHNAYLLAAAEAGLVGMCLFAVALYVSLKVPLALWLGDHAVSATVRRFAPAIFVSLAGCAVGIFFLSWAYKDVLYIALGLSAALHAAARAEDRSVSVRVSAREIALVCAAVTAVLVGLILFVRIRA
ncbi:MAG: O-antigen ligase domain-containing protein, partial [Polyangiaceae bacterium]|nr:O-antigen ligase domain-containing protein [Polyangiaceae bacterium]